MDSIGLGHSDILRENTERVKGFSMPRIFSLSFPFIVLVLHCEYTGFELSSSH